MKPKSPEHGAIPPGLRNRQKSANNNVQSPKTAMPAPALPPVYSGFPMAVPSVHAARAVVPSPVPAAAFTPWQPSGLSYTTNKYDFG